MSTAMKWKVAITLTCCFFGVAALCLVAFRCFVPYGLAEMKFHQAGDLSRAVKDWNMQGKPAAYGFTNTSQEYYVYRTNLTFDSNVYVSVMRLDSPYFRMKGHLLATEQERVFWADSSGEVEELVWDPKMLKWRTNKSKRN